MIHKNKIKNFLCLAGMLILAACGGGTETSASSTEVNTITGTLPSSTGSTALKAAVSTIDCVADTIIATGTSGTADSTETASDCSFSLTLSPGSYVLSFAKNESFVATLIFDSGITGFLNSALQLTSTGITINLGSITLNGNVALAENNPLGFLDQDDDDVVDAEDDDDDGDGTDDDLERDCDLDGLLDDIDDDDCPETISASENILRVKPVSEATDVDLDKDIKVLTSCVLDQNSVTAETFSVTSEEDEVISCVYEFSGENSGNKIKCRHDEEPFVANTVYTVVIGGVFCETGEGLVATTWSFTTETEDDDEGDSEDDLDDEDELEDDDDEDENDEDQEDEDD